MAYVIEFWKTDHNVTQGKVHFIVPAGDWKSISQAKKTATLSKRQQCYTCEFLQCYDLILTEPSDKAWPSHKANHGCENTL